MVIYRHHKGGLEESMKTQQEFDSFEDLQKYIVEYMKPYMNLKQSDIVASDDACYDERTGWKNTRYLCIAGYSNVSDKEEVEKYFGGKYERPQCIGMFATEY